MLIDHVLKFSQLKSTSTNTLENFTLWFGAAVISWTFPVAANNPSIGDGNAFMFFCVMMFLHLLFAWKVFLETKGKSLEQIQKNLG